MKPEVRVVGIDDSPFDKRKDRDILVVGSFFRGGTLLDGVMSTRARVDGNNSTKKIAAMLNNSKFKPQLQAALLDGIAVGGFNVIDIVRLNELTRLPVIVVMRDYPDFSKIKRALKIINKESKIKLMEKAGAIHKVGKIHIQLAGISLEKARQILKITCTRSHIPEPVRISHLIAGGIKEGESRGRA